MRHLTTVVLLAAAVVILIAQTGPALRVIGGALEARGPRAAMARYAAADRAGDYARMYDLLSFRIRRHFSPEEFVASKRQLNQRQSNPLMRAYVERVTGVDLIDGERAIVWARVGGTGAGVSTPFTVLRENREWLVASDGTSLPVWSKPPRELTSDERRLVSLMRQFTTAYIKRDWQRMAPLTTGADGRQPTPERLQRLLANVRAQPMRLIYISRPVFGRAPGGMPAKWREDCVRISASTVGRVSRTGQLMIGDELVAWAVLTPDTWRIWAEGLSQNK